MFNLDQAIQNRLEEKRRVKEAAIAAQCEKERLIIANEIEIARQAKEILTHCLDVDFSQSRVLAGFSHIAGIDSYYKITIELPDSNGSYVATDSNVQAPGNVLDVESLLSSNWRAVHVYNAHTRDCRTTVDGDVLEAVIFAKYGTVEPEETNV